MKAQDKVWEHEWEIFGGGKNAPIVIETLNMSDEVEICVGPFPSEQNAKAFFDRYKFTDAGAWDDFFGGVETDHSRWWYHTWKLEQ